MDRRVTTVMTASGLLKTSVVVYDTHKDRTPVMGGGGSTTGILLGSSRRLAATHPRRPIGCQPSRQDLSSFTTTAILFKTNRMYEKEWVQFQNFVTEETGSDNPFLTGYTDDEKASLVAL